MQSDVHQRARFLIEDAVIARLSKRDECWLRNHLKDCGECAGFSEATTHMLQGLRSLSFAIDPGMNQRVQDAVLSHAAAGKDPSNRYSGVKLTPPRRAVLVAAVLLVLAPSLYRTLKDRQEVRTNADDQALLESIAANVSRGIPEALEPLGQAASPEVSRTPRSDVARGSR